MKKNKFLLAFIPTVAMLMSGCAFLDSIKSFFGIQQKEEITTGSVSIPQILRTEIGATTELKITKKPKDFLIVSEKWTSADQSVATVKNGKVVGVGVGTTTITLTIKDKGGKTSKSFCRVTVSETGKTDLNYTYDDYHAYNAYPTDNCPLSGTAKLLVFPVWFDDSDQFIDLSKKDSVRKDIEIAFKGTNEETGWRSLKTFYEEESFGKLKIKVTVADWYETGTSYETYATNPDGANATDRLINVATNKFFKDNKKESRKDYDSNGDGYLDGVLFIYAAPDKSNLGDGSKENLWAYTSWKMNSPNKDNPVPNVIFWGSYDFMYNYGDYAERKTGNSRYGRGDTRFCNIDAHCYIHEMGHVFGLPDYYDYSGQYVPAGGFSMQDSNVGGHDPHSVLAYGWGNVYQPTETTTITINDFQSSHDVILLANHDVTSVFDEYMLLELYSPTGLNEFDSEHLYLDRYPQGPDDIGIRLWHVDTRLTYWNYYTASWSTSLVTNPKKGNVYLAMANTYYDSTQENYYSISPLGVDYANYNNLDLIRKDGDRGELYYGNLFFENDGFDLGDYRSQFVNGVSMNDGEELGWTFKVDQIKGTTATITVTKQ